METNVRTFVCPICNETVKELHWENYELGGKKVCDDCYYEHKFFAVTKSYISYGNDFNVEDVGKIKIYIHHDGINQYYRVGGKRTFYLSVFARTTYERKEKRDGLSGNPCEFSFTYDLSEFYTSYEISKETFAKIFTKNINRVRVPERKALMECQAFVDYAYDCLTKTINRYNKHMLDRFGL